jgi:hypothetical protein
MKGKSLKTAKPAIRASNAKRATIPLKVAEVMEAVEWLLAMPVGGLLSAQAAQLLAERLDNDFDRNKQAVWEAAAQYLTVYETAMRDEEIERLKAAWTKTKYVPWPLPERLWAVNFLMKPLKSAAPVVTDDDCPF